ncbi:MAG: PAS domain-containing protein [Bernardetiaceae bacterium]|nr:PAS domain-containing protein [Bernardetiaceae bacterium]
MSSQSAPSHYLKTELYELLRTDERIFDFIQEAALDGLWYWDLENPENEWMNPKFWQVLGYDPEEMPHLVSAWQSIINPEDLALAYERIQKHLENPDFPYDQIIRYRHKEGHTVWVRCRGMAVRNAEGKPIRMMGAHTDVTEAKEAELKAKQDLEFYRNVLNTHAAFVLKFDQEGKYKYINEHYIKIKERDATYFKEKKVGDCIIPEDKAKLWAVIKKAFAIVEQPHTVILRERDAKNKVLTIEWEFKALYNTLNDSNEILAVGIDITEKERAKKDLLLLTNILNDAQRIANLGGWELNLETGKTTWTEHVYAIHEVDRSFDHNKVNGIEFYHPEDRHVIQSALENTIQNHEPFDVSCRFITAKGNLRRVRASGKVVLKDGKPYRIVGMFQDITQQWEAAQELKKMETFLRLTNEIANMGSWEFDLASEKVYWSDIKKSIYEVPQDIDLSLEKALSYYEDSARDKVQNIITEAIAQGKGFDYEAPIITGKGNKKWVLVKGEYLQNNEGNMRLLGSVQDITARKEADLALLAVNKRLDAFFQQSLTGFFFMMFDEPLPWHKMKKEEKEQRIAELLKTQKITKVNRAMCEQYKAKESEFLGKTVYELFKHNLEAAKEMWIELFDKGQIHIDTNEKNFEGEDIIIEGDYICLYDNEGNITGHFGVQQDVTQKRKDEAELKQTKQKLENIFAEIEDVVWSVSYPDLKTIFMTPSTERMYGYSLEEWIEDSSLWAAVIIPEDKPIVDKILKNLQNNGFSTERYRILTKSGELKWVLNKSKVIFNKVGEPIRIDGITSDITLQQQRKSELKQILHITEEQNERLKNFAHIVSHNLRSHSGNFMALLELLLQDRPDIAEAEIFPYLQEASKNLRETVVHLTEIVAIDNTTKEHLMPINLHHAIVSATQNVRALAREAKVDIFYHTEAAERNLEVYGIPAYLDSVLLNFMTNAIKYSRPRAESYLRIKIEQTDKHICIHIIDNGLGIDLEKHREQLFGMHKTFHGNKDARGVGLFISKKQIEAMEGSIEVESKVNVGSKFKICLKKA